MLEYPHLLHTQSAVELSVSAMAFFDRLVIEAIRELKVPDAKLAKQYGHIMVALCSATPPRLLDDPLPSTDASTSPNLHRVAVASFVLSRWWPSASQRLQSSTLQPSQYDALVSLLGDIVAACLSTDPTTFISPAHVQREGLLIVEPYLAQWLELLMVAARSSAASTATSPRATVALTTAAQLVAARVLLDTPPTAATSTALLDTWLDLAISQAVNEQPSGPLFSAQSLSLLLAVATPSQHSTAIARLISLAWPASSSSVVTPAQAVDSAARARATVIAIGGQDASVCAQLIPAVCLELSAMTLPPTCPLGELVTRWETATAMLTIWAQRQLSAPVGAAAAVAAVAEAAAVTVMGLAESVFAWALQWVVTHPTVFQSATDMTMEDGSSYSSSSSSSSDASSRMTLASDADVASAVVTRLVVVCAQLLNSARQTHWYDCICCDQCRRAKINSKRGYH
jgi:hypothetical protein